MVQLTDTARRSFSIQSSNRLASCAFLAVAVGVAIAGPKHANASAIPLGTSPVLQTFDSIGTSAGATLPTGWKIADDGTNFRNVKISYTGAGSSLDSAAGGGSPIVLSGSYDLGSGSTDSGTDRAVGFLGGTGSHPVASGDVFVEFQPSTSLNSLGISYDVEKYRDGTAADQVQMYFSTDGTSWSFAAGSFQTAFAPDADTLACSPAPGATASVSSIYTPAATLTAAKPFYLAFCYSMVSGTTNNSVQQSLAIDNVSVTGINGSTPTPEPVGFAAVIVACGLMTRRPHCGAPGRVAHSSS